MQQGVDFFRLSGDRDWMNAAVAALSAREAVLVHEVGKGTPQVIAAKIAGFADSKECYTILRRPHIQAAIAAELRKLLLTKAAPAAINLLYKFMTDESRDDKLRVACAKTLADRAGFIAPKASENNSMGRKAFIDMSAEDLRQASQDILKELGDRAVVVVDSTPDSAPNEAQPFDILD